MNLEDRFTKVVRADLWKKNLNLMFYTKRYCLHIESVAYLPRQTAVVAKHDHVMYQLRYCPTGHGMAWIDEETYPINPGSFFIIAPFVPHYQVHSAENVAEEYTVFLEIIPVKENASCENETFFNDLDSILDIIVSRTHFFGEDVHHAGEIMANLCKQIMENRNQINISLLWIGIMQMLVAAAQNIKSIPQVDVNDLKMLPDDKRSSLLDAIFRDYHEQISQESVACELGISVRHLNRITKKYYGMTFKQKYSESRLELATTLLEEADILSIEEIAQKLNFSSDRYFSRCFKEKFGESPKEYRKRFRKSKSRTV